MHVGPNVEQEMLGNFTSSYRPEKSYTKSGDDLRKSLIFENPVHKEITIPRLKVLCHHKEQRRLHCTIPPPGDENNFVNQKRMAEVQQQNAMITSMLEDQKQLKRERCSIALEVSSMRNHLDAIRGRLDSSLKKLEQNKTYNEGYTSSSALKKLKVKGRAPIKKAGNQL